MKLKLDSPGGFYVTLDSMEAEGGMTVQGMAACIASAMQKSDSFTINMGSRVLVLGPDLLRNSVVEVTA